MADGLVDDLERRVIQAIADGFNRPSTISRRTCIDPKRVTSVLAGLRKKKMVLEASGCYSIEAGGSDGPEA